MFIKEVNHIWKSVFSVWGYRGLKSLIPGGPSFLWASCSQAGGWILHKKKKSQGFIWYCPRKVYLKILQCRLWGISTNALTHVEKITIILIIPVEPHWSSLWSTESCVIRKVLMTTLLIAIAKVSLLHCASLWRCYVYASLLFLCYVYMPHQDDIGVSQDRKHFCCEARCPQLHISTKTTLTFRWSSE